MNFLGDHGFRFHHLVDTAADGEFGDVAAGFGRIRRPENVTTAFFHTLFEFQKIAIEIIECFPFDFMATLAGGFPVGEAGATSIVGAAVLIDAAADDLTMSEVGGF